MILKYLPEEIRQLKAQGSIPEVFSDGESHNDDTSFVDNLDMSADEESDSDSDSEPDMSIQKKVEQNKEELDLDDI